MSDDWQGYENKQAAWSAHECEQLRHFQSLSLRQKMEAVQGMADVLRRFKDMRRQGRFTGAGSSQAGIASPR